MIFPNYNYQDFHNGNKEQWPIQPATQEAWNTMHNLAVAYCENNKTASYPKRIKPHHLPTFHKYWQRQASTNTLSYVKTLISKLKKCISNPELYKIEFRKGSSYFSVVNSEILPKIKEYNLNIKIPKDNVKNKSLICKITNEANIYIALNKKKSVKFV